MTRPTGAAPRTSHTDPLQIVSVPARSGRIGMTFCPGKKQPVSGNGIHWDRQLDVDITALVSWGARAVATFNEAWELEELGVPNLGAAVQAAGMAWHHLPIVDASVPDAAFEAAWQGASADLHARLAAGEGIVLHCKGGLGRTGMLAARLLVETGVAPEAAIQRVRVARRGAIETAAQERYVREMQWRR